MSPEFIAEIIGKNDTVSPEFLPSYELSESESKGVQDLWNTCFDEETGYFVQAYKDQPQELEKSKQMVQAAFDVMFYAHEGQRRGTGGPFSTHPLAVAALYAAYKPPAEGLVAALLHDVVEDSPKNNHPVTLEQITDLFSVFDERAGEIIGSTIDALTKVRKIQKKTEEEKLETFGKLLASIKEYPQALVIKLCDRLHNMSTIDGKEFTDQMSIAIDTYQVYVPLARKLGLHEVADQLEHFCFAVFDKSYGDEFSQKVRTLKNFMGSDTARRDVERKLSTTLSEYSVSFSVSLPSLSDFSKTSAEIQGADMFYWDVSVIVPAGEVSQPLQNILKKMVDSPSFMFDSTRDVPLSRFLSLDHGNYHTQPFWMLHSDDEHDEVVQMRVRFWSEKEYVLDHFSITNLFAIDASDEQRALAIEKHERIKKWYEDIKTRHSDNSIAIAYEVMLNLPGAIAVTKKSSLEKDMYEYTRVPIPEESTLLDYILLHESGRWHRLKQVFVNGSEIANLNQLSRLLHAGDTIEIKFLADEEKDAVSPYWLDAVDKVQDRALYITHHLSERIIGGDTEVLERVCERGYMRLKQDVQNFSYIGLLAAEHVFIDIPTPLKPLAELSVSDKIAFFIGLNLYPYDAYKQLCTELKHIIDGLEKFEIVVLQQKPGTLASVLDAFQKLKVNVAHAETVTDDGKEAIVQIWVNPLEQGFDREKYERACKKAKKNCEI